MLWGSFSYNKKGPCHIWKPEAKKDRELAEKEFERLNLDLEPIMKEIWELEVEMARLGLRKKPGKLPAWKFTAKNGRLTSSVAIDKRYRLRDIDTRYRAVSISISCCDIDRPE